MAPRPIRIEGNVAYVPLTKGYEAIIDAADAHLVGGWSWSVFVNTTVNYAQRTQTLIGVRRTVRLHRVIMGDPGGLVIDHIDGDGLNNRRANLRLAAHAENMRNQRLRSDSTSGHKGVNWDSTRGKWVARIWLSGKCRHLGCFTSVESASEAYAAAIHESHGAFGRVA